MRPSVRHCLRGRRRTGYALAGPHGKGPRLDQLPDDGGKRFAHEVKINPVPEAILADGQNRPKVVAGGGVVAVTWAQALPKLHTGHIRFARSVDGGRTFSTPITVNDNLRGNRSQLGTLALDDKGRMALVWLDGRERAAAVRQGGSYRSSSVQYVLSEDRGATFSPNRKLADHSCECCCRIGLAFTPEGEAVAQWRHVFGDNIRDFAMAPLRADSSLVRASHDDWHIAASSPSRRRSRYRRVRAPSSRLVLGSAKGAGICYRFADGAQLSARWRSANPDAPGRQSPRCSLAAGRVVLGGEFDGRQYQVLAQQSADRGITWSSVRESCCRREIRRPAVVRGRCPYAAVCVVRGWRGAPFELGVTR